MKIDEHFTSFWATSRTSDPLMKLLAFETEPSALAADAVVEEAAEGTGMAVVETEQAAAAEVFPIGKAAQEEVTK